MGWGFRHDKIRSRGKSERDTGGRKEEREKEQWDGEEGGKKVARAFSSPF